MPEFLMIKTILVYILIIFLNFNVMRIHHPEIITYKHNYGDSYRSTHNISNLPYIWITE